MHRFIILCCTLLSLLLLSACKEPVVIVVTATPTESTGAGTETATALPSPTVGATATTAATAVPETATPPATATPIAAGSTERITFAPGATSASRNGMLNGGETPAYLLNAAAGQVLDIVLHGLDTFTVAAPDGTTWSSEGFSYDGTVGVRTIALPVTGDYTIELSPPLDADSLPYEITFTVLNAPQPGDAAERVEFVPAATEAVRTSALTAASKSYLLNAGTGQQLSVFATTRRVPFHFVITAPNGTTVTSEQLGSEVQVRAAELTLPVGGDYQVTVTSDVPSEALLFDITFRITGAIGAAEPERVTFVSGAVSATRSGTLTGSTPYIYVINAGAGQVMEVRANGNPAGIDMMVTAPDGTTYAAEHVEFFGRTQIVIELPVSGDYVTQVTKTTGAAAIPTTDYEITFTVLTPSAAGAAPERVTFAAGATTATRSGALGAGDRKQYLLNIAAGQRLQVTATSFDIPVEFSVAAPSGLTWNAVLLGSEIYIFNVAERVLESGDYLVTIAPPLAAGAGLYDINFEVTGTVGAFDAERVTFAPGATAATLTGIVPGGVNVKSFVLGAAAGQTMTVNATTDGAPFDITISTSLGGAPLASGNTPDFGSGSASLVLPATQDYFVTLRTPLAAGDTGYMVTIAIE